MRTIPLSDHPITVRQGRFARGRCVSWLGGLAAAALTLQGLMASAQAIEIVENDQAFEVASGAYGWVISKTDFNVLAEASDDGVVKIDGGEASAEFLGDVSVFGPPSEFLKGEDWVELRGWADEDKNLWYVAYYRFFEGQPFTHLAISLMDRHDDYQTEGEWDDYWQERFLSDFQVSLHTTSDLQGRFFQQSSSFTGREIGVDHDIIIQQNEGSPFQWRPDLYVDGIELLHGITEDPDRATGRTNSITWVPNHQGRAQLVALLTPGYDYQSADDVAYEVQHVGGVERLLIDQTSKELDLGSYELDQDSAVSVFTESTSGSEGVVRARGLRVIPEKGEPYEIDFKRLPDDILQDSGYALGVVDLWQHHPIELFSSGREFGVNAITEPERWSGGIGLTLDLALVIDATRTDEALTAIKAPPATRSLPAWWSAFEGTMTPHGDYDRLVGKAIDMINSADDDADSYGWRGYGDYQIGVSYSYDNKPFQDYGGLQYDLTTGLLLAWMRTGDERLWQRARAALRHQMDVSMAKFYPFAPKRSGHLYRKGECDVDTLITCQEPIPDFGYGWRAFLLWHHLTGEPWALDIAHQNIDALAYFGARTGGADRSMNDWLIETGSRPLGWVLRALLTGKAVFPEGTRGYHDNGEGVTFEQGTDYGLVLEEILVELADHIVNDIGHYPSDQPVWSGQGIEALGMAYLDPSGRYRNEQLKRAVLSSCEDLIASMRRSGGLYEFVYDRDGEEVLEWTDNPNYGWLWLGGLSACAEIGEQPSFDEAAEALFENALDEASAAEEISTRDWSSLLGFGGRYLDSLKATN